MLPKEQSLLGGRIATHTNTSVTPPPQTVGAPTKKEGGVQIILNNPPPMPPGPTGTLASQDPKRGASPSPGARSVQPATGTLPSKDLPMLDPRAQQAGVDSASSSGAVEVQRIVRVGVPGWLLAVAIIVSLLLGFIAGFAARGRR